MSTFVNDGIAAVAGLVNGDVTTSFGSLAIGTDDGTTLSEGATNSALGSEITTNGGSRTSATTSRVTTSVTDDTAQWVHQWTFTGTLGINECGVFDTSTSESGTMLMRHVFSSTKNVEVDDTLEITVKMQIS